MPDQFDLVVTADYPSRTAEFRLLDGQGSQIASRSTDFNSIAVSRRRGLFDLRNYVRHYVEEGKCGESVAKIGVCIAEEVLGAEIFRALWDSQSRRTLRIQLPEANVEEDLLAAALARVPWEIARPSVDQPTLGERNLLVRVVHEMAEAKSAPIALGPNECLRVLFVFAEARGSQPLGARRARRELLGLFEKDIYPKRRVVAHVLSHGFTRERLEAQIRENGGYHVVHWSGHGHLNLLELARTGGGRDLISGKDLLKLFIRAGGYIPRLFFLSACHSGDILRVKDWHDFLAMAQGKELGAEQGPPAETKDIPLDKTPGYTGTAHALLQGGVPTVIAMRYAVGDEYARDLAVAFFRALWAYAQPQAAASALTTARQSLLDSKKHDGARYHVCDHATPVLYGSEQPGLTPPTGSSPGLDPRHTRLNRVAELTTAGHEHFVGRTWELAGMGAEFIGSRDAVDVKPMALIIALGGMGKTALAAEALALWESRFEWVLLYQAKPNALGFEATLRDIHLKLYGELGRYHEHVKEWPADAIHRAADAEFTGPERLERLTRNLVRALQDEPILLVLDNFETNLKPQAEPTGAAGEPVWACRDPAWDRCLALLAAELVGSPSRVLITCRRPLAALAGAACRRVLLGPLHAGEAALHLREHPSLSGMMFGSSAAERALAMRLLNASRFYPLLMDRLARLAAGGPILRAQLMQALDTLEKSNDLTQLPELFAAVPGDTKELAYLEDALTISLDQLIRDASPDARRLLWMIAVANDPVNLMLLKGAWSGESHEHEQLRQIKRMLDMLPDLPAEQRLNIEARMTPQIRVMIDALPTHPPVRPDPAPLLRHLLAVGLATETCASPDDADPDLTCHELVRERIFVWMRDHPQDQADLTENTIRLAYAERLEAVFRHVLLRNMSPALEAGSRASVYYVQAHAYERLGSLASGVVNSTSNPLLLHRLRPHLESAIESAPEGPGRWRCLCALADALRNAGHPDDSLRYYEQAENLVRTAAEAEGGNRRETWGEVAHITGSWANGLFAVGEMDRSRQRHLQSAAAHKKAETPAINTLRCEVEALRIDIMQGRAAEALPQVEARLAQLKFWWRQHCSGQSVPEAPDPGEIVKGLISTLNVAANAHVARQAEPDQHDLENALSRSDDALEVKRTLQFPQEEIAVTRIDRAGVLGKLHRFDDAQAELEDCLQILQDNPSRIAAVRGSLAALFYEQGDVAQAIIQQRRSLALREHRPLPGDRALSHINLATFLECDGAPSAHGEAVHHRLAALVYQIVSGLGRGRQHSLRGFALVFCHARAIGTEPSIPRLAELLADHAFRPLDDWLRGRGVTVEEVQAAVDQAIGAARQAALEPE